MNRRNFLSVATLPFFVQQGKAQPVTPKKKVVWLWLGGGISHIETFTPIPNAPEEYRAVNGSIKTSIPGIMYGSDFKHVASLAQHVSVVRSFTHGNAGHGGGTHWLMTGHDFPAADNGGDQNMPSLGSVLAKHRGASGEKGLPSYISTGNFDIQGDDAIWLGPAFSPFRIKGEASNNLELTISLDSLNDRKKLLASFDNISRDLDTKGMLRGMDSIGKQSLEMIQGDLKRYFDIDREPLKLKDKYGVGLGRDLLQARMLVESGVSFVTVNSGGWDMHSDIKKQFTQLSLRNNIDRAIATFIEDLRDRGLEDEVLLVITSEFGRTPKINKDGGRDHWPNLSTLAFAGGGLKMGQVIGQETDRAEFPKSNPITPKDLVATIMQTLGMPLDTILTDPTGRPIKFCDGTPIKELF